MVVRCFGWRFLGLITLSVVILNSSVTLLLLECFLVDAVEARYDGFQRCFFVSFVFTGHYLGTPNREKAETTTWGLMASEFLFFCNKRSSPVVPLPWRTPRVFFYTMNNYRKGYYRIFAPICPHDLLQQTSTSW